MPSDRPELRDRPKADAESVEALVKDVLRGHVRTPVFQRPLKWKAQDVVDLFDSILRGLPVGSLMFNKGKATAGRITIGPLTIDAPEVDGALWTVDGQQRITALTASLARRLPFPEVEDPWILWFDPESETFHHPRKGAPIPSTWVPLPILGDASGLQEWLFAWEHKEDATLRNRVFSASSQIREFRIPYYVFCVEDEVALREIFYRVNKSGKPLQWTEVHEALFARPGTVPSTVAELSKDLDDLGMGGFSENRLFSALRAMRGLDVTRGPGDHIRNEREKLENMVPDGLPVMRRTMDFLRRHAGILHLRLLPWSDPVLVLARFLALHPQPKPRTLDLLTRWTWRVLVGHVSIDERTLLRRAIRGITDDEEESVQRLLHLAPTESRSMISEMNRFDARSAESRLAGIALSSLGPVDLVSGKAVDVAGLLEEHQAEAFCRIVDGSASVANRMLHPGGSLLRNVLLDHADVHGAESNALRSHALDAEGVALLRADNVDEFLSHRTVAIQSQLLKVSDRFAVWNRGDRPSISHLVGRTEPEE